MPAYFQACKDASPVKSGVEALPFAATTGTLLMLTGITVAVSKAYRVQLWVAWACFMISLGVMTTVHADTPLPNTLGFSALVGVASGIVYSCTYYPVLAPLPASENAHALALFAFFRSFAAVRPFFILFSSYMLTPDC